MTFDWDSFLTRMIHDARAILRSSAIKTQLVDRRWEEAPPDLRRLLQEAISEQAKLDLFFRRLGVLAEAFRKPSADVLPLMTIVGLARISRKDRLASAGGELQIGDSCETTAPASLQLVLEELIDNSIRFASAERPLAVRIDAQLNPECLRITFTDNASGWDAKLGEKMFLPFEKLDARGGTGLGLAIARAIATSAGGTIVAAANPTGTVFTIDLPRDS